MTGGTLTAISDKLLRVLPPAMVVLVILNVVFLGVTSYTFSHNTDARNLMLTKIIDACLQRIQPNQLR